MPPGPAVSAVVVTYRQVELTLAAVRSLEAQTVPPREIVVVDNDPERSAHEPLAAAHPQVRVLAADNVGYAPACNLGAAEASGDWLLFLNPDAEADPDCLERLLEVAAEHPRAGIVTPQILFPDRALVNAGENRIHLTGIAWCGRYGEPPESGPARPALITTGAAMLVRADLYRLLDGYCDQFFLYYEDPDICLRAWLAGAEVWFVPEAVVVHHYAFGESTVKWFHLERNRLLSLLTTWRLSTLTVLAPLLAGTELALLLVALREGWLPEKLRAYRSVWGRRAWIRRRRRAFARVRALPDAAVLPRLDARVESPQIESTVGRRAAPLLVAYRALAVALVRALGR